MSWKEGKMKLLRQPVRKSFPCWLRRRVVWAPHCISLTSAASTGRLSFLCKNQVNKRAKRGCRKWGKVPTIGRRGRARSSGGAKCQLAEIIRAEYVIIHI